MEEEAPNKPSQTMSVLLIEDNPEDEYLVRRLLSKAPRVHATITAVRSYADAADALGSPFDICLMDYDLGDYNAIDLLAKLPVVELSGPIVLLTGHEDIDIDQAALELGVADYITKSQITTALLDRTLRYTRRQFEDQRRLTFLAHHDPLTNLLNRHAFLDRLTQWLDKSPLSKQDIYLLYIDLDGFKAINDNWGHDIGDTVIQHAANCLSNSVRSTDLVARYGGDEMVAAVTNIERDNIEDFAGKLLAAIRRPFVQGSEEMVISASIGIARASQAPDDPLEILRLADHAMFAAKRSGRDTFRVYSSDVPLQARTRASMEIELRNALKKNQLHLVYQPQLDLASGRLIGAEALARWSHETRGDISPGTFIPLAEECGLIRPLTTWSIRAALETLEEWAYLLPPDFRLSVNISAAQLLDLKFVERLQNLLTNRDHLRQWLRLEITESFFLHEAAAQQINALRDANISIALDDFGTGYSSLSQLARLPIDTLKIDLSFVQNLTTDPRMAALTRAIISIAQDLGMGIIAEGVETQAQADTLLEYGCPVAQGFLFARGEREYQFHERLRSDYRSKDTGNTSA